MKIITYQEFKDQESLFLDLAKKEQLIVRQNKQSFLIVPISEEQETDLYFSDPIIQAQIQQAIDEIAAGKGICVANKKELSELLDSL